MSTDAVIGCVVLSTTMLLLVSLTVWSRRRIERIARSHGRSAREIEKGLRGE
ncbi:MAG: hypothetical protein ACYS8X_11655 [Planctomycetota bacterium]|jgi:hypothetical protein